MLHPMFYSLSFLSQRVEALTCPKCIAPDHSKSKCALSSLEPIREQSCSQQTNAGRQSGLPRKRFQCGGIPTQPLKPKSLTASKVSASDIPNRVIVSTDASAAERSIAWWTALCPSFIPHRPELLLPTVSTTVL